MKNKLWSAKCEMWRITDEGQKRERKVNDVGKEGMKEFTIPWIYQSNLVYNRHQTLLRFGQDILKAKTTKFQDSQCL
jgi:hypothetical protein